VVDDSAIVRKILSQELGRYAGIEIVGTAAERIAPVDRIAETLIAFAQSGSALASSLSRGYHDGIRVGCGRFAL